MHKNILRSVTGVRSRNKSDYIDTSHTFRESGVPSPGCFAIHYKEK